MGLKFTFTMAFFVARPDRIPSIITSRVTSLTPPCDFRTSNAVPVRPMLSCGKLVSGFPRFRVCSQEETRFLPEISL